MVTLSKKRSWKWFEDEEEDEGWASQQAITPWHSSVPSLSHLQRDIEQIFAKTFRNLGWSAPSSSPDFWSSQAVFQPSVNIASNEKEYIVTVEIPGMEERDIKLDISPNGLLTISGEKRQESEDIDRDYECVECFYGVFQRTLSLPEDTDHEAVKARFRNGVLTITCPRTETAKPRERQIPINGVKLIRKVAPVQALLTPTQKRRRSSEETEWHSTSLLFPIRELIPTHL
jgi:HSP20 family protein